MIYFSELPFLMGNPKLRKMSFCNNTWRMTKIKCWLECLQVQCLKWAINLIEDLVISFSSICFSLWWKGYLYLPIHVWRKSMLLSICSQSSRQITGKAAVSTVVWTLCDLRCSPLLTLDYVPSSSWPSHKVSLYWQKNTGNISIYKKGMKHKWTCLALWGWN